ncbi:TatD family hydrolase [Dethiosulfovibrio salsuginis]|nr:TatD family hydrolase [Dethiosulfovibrio salsuginis]
MSTDLGVDPMTPYIDGHCHLNSPELREDVQLHVDKAVEAGVGRMLVVGSDEESSWEAVDMASRFSPQGVRASVGIHPHEAGRYPDGIPSDLLAMADRKEVFAVGEIGLDYHYDHSPRSVQREVMAAQIGWAKVKNLPVVFHVREAFADFFSLINDNPLGDAGGVVHCFSGSWSEAKMCLDLGLYLGFGGMITFKSAQEVRECLSSSPMDRIILETDSPWLAPVPYRGKTNTPSMMPLIYRAASDITGRTLSSVAQSVWQNGKDLYRWGEQDV